MRKMLGLTRRELADRLDTTETTIYRKERGDRQLRTEELELYAKALGCEPNDLLGTTKLDEEEQPTIDSSLFYKCMSRIRDAARKRGARLDRDTELAIAIRFYNEKIKNARKDNVLEPTIFEAESMLQSEVS